MSASTLVAITAGGLLALWCIARALPGGGAAPTGSRFLQIAVVSSLLLVVCRHRRRLLVIVRTLPRDLKFLCRFVRADCERRRYKNQNLTVIKIFRERARLQPDAPCFIYDGQVWSNAQIQELSNRVASLFQRAGYEPGDAVALMMANKPQYPAIWLGLGKIGVVTALINTNLRLQSLAHCLNVARVKAIIYDRELAEAVEAVSAPLDDFCPGIERYEFGSTGDKATFGAYDLSEMLLGAEVTEPMVTAEPGYRDNLLYVYTSGTTGLPKAALFPHSRYLLVQSATYHMLGLRPDDVMYNPIPLYHIAGGVAGTSCALIKGIPTVLRAKFSVKSYWSDCIKYKCTIAQYIGEMCRYLLTAPPKPEDSEHFVRLMVGNGMRPQIWEEFVNRFKIAQVTEVYGSSEGNANIVNVDNTVGAVGFVPSFLPKALHPVAVIRVDQDTCEPIRGPDGFCVRAEPNEPGMFIGIIMQGNAQREFNGYLDKEASKKKIIENVFRKGERAFVTGDILVQDELGYLYFKDRTGDTFRWKGENVATAEVEGVISNIVDHKETTVYGVQIPNAEGRAGMAAIVDPNETVDLKALAQGLEKALPSYARPLFVRIVKELELTGTYKVKKMTLQSEGFNPNKILDKVYFKSVNDGYVLITPELYKDITSGVIKF